MGIPFVIAVRSKRTFKHLSAIDTRQPVPETAPSNVPLASVCTVRRGIGVSIMLHRSAIYSCLQLSSLLLVLVTFAPQNATAATAPQSDPSAIAWATRSIAVLTNGQQVSGISAQGNVTRLPDQDSGTVTLSASGLTDSRLDLSTTTGVRSEIRTSGNRGPAGEWIDIEGQHHPFAQHNCWTDAAWFFPALTMLSAYSDPTVVFTDLGQETHQGLTVEHIQVYRTFSDKNPDIAKVLSRVSTVNYYLESQTAIPIAISFDVHPDKNEGAAIPIEVRYSDYRRIGSVLVPFEVDEYLNRSPLIQISLTSASPN